MLKSIKAQDVNASQSRFPGVTGTDISSTFGFLWSHLAPLVSTLTDMSAQTTGKHRYRLIKGLPAYP